MRKSVFAAAVGCIAAVSLSLNCGKSYCKQYTEKFCSDEKAEACTQAKAKIKDLSSAKCRIELNNFLIEEQSKQTDKLFE